MDRIQPSANSAGVMNKPFRLLDLPPELWARICTLAILDPADITIQHAYHPNLVCSQTLQPPLTRTCRVLRGECVPLFYKLVNFIILDEYVDVDGNLKWLRSLGKENRRRFQRLYLASRCQDPGAPYFGDDDESGWDFAEVNVLSEFGAEFEKSQLDGWRDPEFKVIYRIKLTR
ncbi:hypothetical protein KC363_g717 [Hortaea werneckii]|uniref:F-box domain-containing protein n=1 Tax=Hortaea werneckii TaxID=91943 RepID=A0A3M7G613_HORWE|nr:hypothetical protein KC361_g3507 [Hortaea werneckii]KAI6885774.1 hypothetical protein KC325_g3307 [Hortaea werneckii]KAI6995192.1 hypothetical protein KC359_g4203 [Hortaea werneckii]KAI7147145.1 hypothetical protein KC344_g3088 [Hortaea werneckii]KAI7175800.1 hypothetical protein KC360_g3405 [Hortaea werneckii]